MKSNLQRTMAPTALTALGRLAHIAAATAFATMTGTAVNAAPVLSPTLPGQYAAGDGVNATFIHIDDNWTGTSVYWNENAKKYANGPRGNGFDRIGSLDWGTGIWGLADWAAINSGSVLPAQKWTGRVSTIDHADREYAKSGYAATWGAIGALPSELFDNNWTAHYTGYLRITNPGDYNFGVLYDDGFFLRIWGAGDSLVEISSDFLSPRDRLGFAKDLRLETGLYRFELGAYDRIEVGAVNLAWMQNGRWMTVPTEYLVTTPTPIPTPGTAVLLLAAVGALALFRMKRKRG